MSTPKPARTYLVLAAILLATTIVAAGAAAYYYSQFTSQQSTNSNLTSKTASLNSDLTTRDAQIADLQQKLNLALAQQTTLQTELNGNVTLLAYVKTQLQTNVTLVASLRAQILTLNTKIYNLEQQIIGLNSLVDFLSRANVIDVFTFTLTPVSSVIGCVAGFTQFCGSGTLNDVAYANVGTIAANNVLLTVSFYASNDGTGTALCSVTQSLGGAQVAGRSIAAIMNLQNSCSTGTTSPGSATGKVTWS